MIDLLRRLAPPLPAALLAFAALFAQATAASAETARIGAFTLSYDPAEWRIDGGGSTFMAVCGVDACSHAVVAVTITPAAEWCDTEVARQAAAAAFPWTNRHASNMHARDGYALYFVSAGDGFYDPDHRDPAYACINHRGLRYEFLSKLGVGEEPGPFHAGAVFDLLSGLAAPPPELIALKVEELTFNLADDVWSAGDPEGADGPWSITCLPPACSEHVGVLIGANPVPLVGTCEAMLLPGDGQYTSSETAVVGDGVAFTVTVHHSMCRAWTPPSVEACAVYNGVRYTVSTGIPISGCYFGPHLGEGTLLDLIEGITVE
ncbi:MAG: hypothetical protein KIS96_09325 [Bauldia sp.]|nr:hypothetical protein [Bauldia sp.]